jgi:hypothetical protein
MPTKIIRNKKDNFKMPSRDTQKWLLPVPSQDYVAVDQKEPLELRCESFVEGHF